jgi:hypothetical protein
MKTELILIKHGLVEIPSPSSTRNLDVSVVGTVLSNLAYYGFVLSKEATNRLVKLTDTQVKTWWSNTERVLKEVTGANKNMEKFVVYKNFPKECLEMSQCQYWVSQIFMYIGFPNEYFTQTEVVRDKMFEKLDLKVLQLAKDNSLQMIYENLLKSPARWTDEQFSFVRYFVVHQKYELNVKLIPFKENLVSILSEVIDNNLDVKISSATDILRLGVALSDGDVTFKTNTKFKSFSRKHRKFLLSQLNNCSNLDEDVARDKNRWKKFLYSLHPGDFTFNNVTNTHHKLYHDDVTTFNSKVESLILQKDSNVLSLLQTRPGEFVRRLHKMIDLFGDSAVKSFIAVLPKLKTNQILKIRNYISSIGNRAFLTIAPKGNWSKLKILPNTKTTISEKHEAKLIRYMDKILSERLNKQFDTGVMLSDKTQLVKLQTNDSDLLPYGRGTTFEIPSNVTFIRSASVWKNKAYGVGGFCSLWYDNGWNFFNSNWKNVGNCCWIENRLGDAAIFSGDPTSAKDVDGNACQMIDLYINKLVEKGIRYAVWNILCYNKVSFDKSDVFAALQWGEEAQKGKLFEPARCQLSFPLKGENMTKYIAYIDLVERKLVYIDANFKGNVRSASSNGKGLEEVMPAYIEYLATIPSVFDLFKNVKKNKKGMPVVYTDEGIDIKNGKAYVFKPVNKDNKYTQISLSNCL